MSKTDNLHGNIEAETPEKKKTRLKSDKLRLCRYMLALKSAAAQIRASHDRPDLAMVLNLGPTWAKSDAYSLFANNVIEITFKGEYETPPGLGLCPLSVIFEACTSISSWTRMDRDNVVVSLFRPCRV